MQHYIQQATAPLLTTIQTLQAQLQHMQQQQQQTTTPSTSVAAAASTSASTSTGTAIRSRKVVHPEKYKGEPGKYVLIHITALEDYFVSLGLQDDAEKLKTATELHAGKAQEWWFNLARLKQRPTTWEEYKALLVERFQGIQSDMVAFTQLETFKQTGSVNDYASDFETLAVLAGYDGTNARDNLYLQRKFITGLKYKIRNKVWDLKPATFEAARKLALEQEAFFATNKQLDDGASTSKGQSSSKDRPNRSAISSAPVPMELGAAEAKTSTRGPNGPARGDRLVLPRADISPEEEKYRRENKLCIYCGRPNHVAKDCRRRLAEARARAMNTR